MKTLTLLRHAKSSWDDHALSDFDRPLNARGERAARAMGRELQRRRIVFDRVLASPAARVVGTLGGLAEGGFPASADYDERIYLASVRTLLGIIHSVDDAHARLLIVGHNPGIAALAYVLSRDGALRDLLADKFPTGALAEISFGAASWASLERGSGTLARFIRPRDLDPALGSEV
jgi:phosphohistidine phosphatase